MTYSMTEQEGEMGFEAESTDEDACKYDFWYG